MIEDKVSLKSASERIVTKFRREEVKNIKVTFSRSVFKMKTNWIFFCLTLLFLNIELSVGEPKRSFGFGRSRPKSNSNLNVRRHGHSDAQKSPQTFAPKQAHSSHAASAPAPSAPKIDGPPPAYSAGPNSGKTQLHAAPPAYSAPPSYSSATGLNSHANYPRQGHANSGTNMHPPGQGYGGSPYNNYGGNSHGGFAQPPPNYGGQPSGGFGGYGGAMPGYGGGMGGGMMGGGMGGGMMGGGMMGGGVQPLYVQQQRSGSPLTSIAGGAIAGLATYQLAKAFSGGSNHHSSDQHIYHHYDHPQENAPGQHAPVAPVAPVAPEAPQGPQGPQQTLHTPNLTPQTTYGAVQQASDVPLAPFPSESTCTENCTPETNVAVTPVPEIDHEFPFSTIHPSLFPYASPSQYKDLEYWAKSVNKKLDSTAPDTDNSSTSSP